MDTEQTAPARRLPHSIGRYRILARLGKGAMGVVYSAHDSVMERTVAIKVMMTDFEDDPEASARFYREARSAGQLVHPNIITIFDMGEEDGRPFIVMELLDAVTLNKFLERPDAGDLELKVDLMIQICDGLQAAHAAGIFHRDIKPGNLLVRGSGELKIVDFGIARLASSNMTASGLIVGTPDYMSPEQARGQEVDARSDIFSSGAVFYYMLTGRKPFAGPDLTAVLLKVQNQEPLPIRESEAPASLGSLVMKALAKNPNDRYQTCAQMSAVLGRARRELRAEAQRWLDECTQSLQAIELVRNERKALSAALDIAVTSTDFDVVRAGLGARRAEFGEDARRRDIGDVLEQTRTLHQSAVADVERWRRASYALEQGVRASSAGAFRYALDQFESALQTEPAARRASAEVDRCRRLIAEKRVADGRAATLLEEARHAMAAKQWQAAAALCGDVLRLDSASTEAAALQRQATDAIEAERRDRRQEADRAIVKAEACRKSGQLDEAARELTRARLSDPTAPDLQASEDRLRASVAQAERDSALSEASAAAIESARRAFAAGGRDEAIAGLKAFHSTSPTALVADEIARLEGDMKRLVAAERRVAQVTEHTRKAEDALGAGDPDRALDFATRALEIESGDVLARKLASLARAEIKERTEARARIAAASRNLDEARQQIARGRFGKARTLISAAAELNPDSEHQAVFELIQQEEARMAAEAQRLRVSRQRARAVAPIVERGREALETGDYEGAAWTAENALAVDPDCAEAREILARSRERLALQPKDSEDTVDLTGGRTGDPDDTVTLIPPQGLWERASHTVKNWMAALKPLGASQSGRQ